MNFGLSEEDIQAIMRVFETNEKVEEAILYGSRAKGDFKAGSDIDLTLKGEDLNMLDLSSIEMQIDDLLLPYSMDISIFSHIKNIDLLDHIHRVGRVFYTRK